MDVAMKTTKNMKNCSVTTSVVPGFESNNAHSHRGIAMRNITITRMDRSNSLFFMKSHP